MAHFQARKILTPTEFIWGKKAKNIDIIDIRADRHQCGKQGQH